jgi:hypothetical protein
MKAWRFAQFVEGRGASQVHSTTRIARIWRSGSVRSIGSASKCADAVTIADFGSQVAGWGDRCRGPTSSALAIDTEG